MKLGTLEVIDSQNLIIQIQSGIINELFRLLMQHISAEEAEQLPCVARIKQAAQIRDEISSD